MTPAQILARCSLFRDFTDTGLQIMASIAVPTQIPPGTSIFREDMVGDSLFVIAQGQVSIHAQGRDGEPRELTVLGPGDSLGELALILQERRMVSATAASDCHLLEIRQRDFAALQRQKPQACLKLLLAISQSFAKHLRDNRDLLRARLLP